ncbi:MAG: ATP:cob(I)alamin adenosyltransferase [Bdellovibrionota bacterium]
MRLDKIYTRVGDKGKTLLANGRKVVKYDLRIHAYGHVDELNSSVGLTRDFISELGRPCFTELVHRLAVVQNELLILVVSWQLLLSR